MNEEKTETTTTEEEQKFRLRTIISDQDVLDLRKPSQPVVFAAGDNSGKVFLDSDTSDLVQALKDYVTQNDGLGMAAVQLGVHKRLFVMRKPFNSDNLLVVINPHIARREGHAVKGEGCFSLPETPGEAMVRRASMIDVTYDDEEGVTHEDTFVGMDARIFQHELDHLDGILMIDQKPNGWGFRGWRRLF